MKTHKTLTITREVVICDRCGRKMDEENDVFEWQEHLAVRFRGGYGSEFGDGNLVEGDFCQYCIKKLLGKYLRITEDDSYHWKHALNGDAKSIYQRPQLKKPE